MLADFRKQNARLADLARELHNYDGAAVPPDDSIRDYSTIGASKLNERAQDKSRELLATLCERPGGLDNTRQIVLAILKECVNDLANCKADSDASAHALAVFVDLGYRLSRDDTFKPIRESVTSDKEGVALISVLMARLGGSPGINWRQRTAHEYWGLKLT